MPKMKTKSGAKKRFRVTASGRVRRAQAGKSHILTKKSRKRVRNLRQGALIDTAQTRQVKRQIPYA